MELYIHEKPAGASGGGRIPLTIYENEFVSVIGDACEITSDSGKIAVYDTGNLIFRESVEKNVSHGEPDAFLSGDRKIMHKRHVAGVMEQTRLEGIGVKRLRELAPFEIFKTELAYLMMSSPEAVVFNNPFKKLDADDRTRIVYEMAKLQKKLGVSFVYCTTDDREAMRISTRVIVINHGKIEQIGSPEELYYAPVSRDVAEIFDGHNIFEGWIREKTGSDALIMTEFGQFVVQTNEFEEDEMLYISIRPEMIRVRESEGDHVKVSGVLTDYHFMGNGYEAVVKLINGQDVVGRMPGKSYEVGSVVYLDWDTEEIALMHTRGDSVYEMIETLSTEVGNSLKVSI